MELLFVVVAAAIMWLYFVNATVCYLVVGGGFAGIVMAVIISKILKARKLKVRMESGEVVNNFEAGAKVGLFHPRPEDLVISQDPT